MLRQSLLCSATVLFAACASQAMFLDAGDAKKAPRGRPGCRPCSRIGTYFPDIENLGSHGYRFEWSEKNGIVYTCRAGFLDIAHVRGAIDRTAFIATKILDNFKKQKTEFSFKLAEPSRYYVRLAPPQNWELLSEEEKDNIVRDISVGLGEYFAHTACIWHEILTWFGYKSIGFFPEYHSAFSCEDTFSDLLGTHLGALALRDAENPFDQAATLALDRELRRLGARNRHVAARSIRMVTGQWFSGGLIFVDTKRRNFDIGLGDESITPWTVPAALDCPGEAAVPYPVPGPEFLSEYGFTLQFEIEPREWEKGKILKIVYPNVRERRKRLDPSIHFAAIMDHIRKDAVRKYGPYVSSGRFDAADDQIAQAPSSPGWDATPLSTSSPGPLAAEQE